MTTKADRDILKKLEEEGNKRGIPQKFLEFYQRLFRIQTRVKRRIGTSGSGLKQKTVDERVERGQRLLTSNKLILDWPLLQDTFTEVTALFNKNTELFGHVPANLSKISPALLKKTVKAWFESGSLPSEVVSDSTNEYLLEAIIHSALKPFLVSHSEALTDQVKPESWRRGYCPICGGSPDFSFLEKEEGARWLMCSRCDTKWAFQRLECPYCGTQDQNALSYLTDDKGLYRLYVCEKCKGYLKTIDLREAESGINIDLERLLTADIDTQAGESGYSPQVKVRSGAASRC